ncbi:MAG: NHL repeat-containing protein, partial [Clostridia bacterium]|nr:NHL repeat-containing protein [Clostridia bacterium]
MKSLARGLAICLVVCTLLASFAGYAAEDGKFTNYTYNYDYWQDEIEMPDAYRVEQVIYSETLGLETPMSKPQSLYIRDNIVYVADTGNNRVLEIERQGNDFVLTRIIDTIQGTEPANLSSPSDMFADENGNLYICDTGNHRVVKVDKDLNHILSFTKPDDSTFDQSGDFSPARLVVDVSGRVYCLATKINKGLVKFEADGEFAGF